MDRSWDTPQGFLNERADFLYVYATKREWGWDVVARIDGTYADQVSAEAAAEGIKRILLPLVQDQDRMHWWDGPPWRTGIVGVVPTPDTRSLGDET